MQHPKGRERELPRTYQWCVALRIGQGEVRVARWPQAIDGVGRGGEEVAAGSIHTYPRIKAATVLGLPEATAIWSAVLPAELMALIVSSTECVDLIE